MRGRAAPPHPKIYRVPPNPPGPVQCSASLAPLFMLLGTDILHIQEVMSFLFSNSHTVFLTYIINTIWEQEGFQLLRVSVSKNQI